MAQKAGEIYYEVDMEIQGLLVGQQKINKRLDEMEGNFNRTSQSASRFEGVLNKVGVAIAAAFTVETAKRLIQIGDEMVTLQARITRLSPSLDVAKETMSSLAAIASQTGNSLSETERLWESLTTSLKSAGATNSQILALTSTLQKIGTIGGSSTEEMANALRQFGQSISGGIVRAEEFNSILEQMPELARQIAAGLGISIGDLRKRMLEGKLTAEDALNAIQKQSQSVNEEFDKMPVSIDRAKNSLDVAFRNAINDLNQAVGLTSTLAGLMQSVADNLNYYNNNAGDASRMPKLIKMQQDLNKEVQEGQRWYETDTVFQQRRAQASFELKRVEQELASIRAKSANDAKNNQGFKGPSTNSDDAATSKLVKNSERRLALARLEGEARARLQAEYDASDAGITDQKRIKALQDEYAETYRVTDAKKESNRENTRAATQAESVAQKLEKMRQEALLVADTTGKLSREQQILNAQLSLGSSATDEQKRKAAEYKAQALDTADALKKQEQAERDKQNTEMAYQNVRNQSSPLAAADSTYQQQMASLNAYAQLYPQKIAEVEQTRATIEEQYRQQRLAAMWDEFAQQNAATMAAAAAFDSLAGNASNALTGILTGSMSVNEALASLGRTILNSVINSFVQMGVEYAKNLILQQTLGSAAIAATGAQAAAAAAFWATPAALAATATAGGAAVAGQAALATAVGSAQVLALAGARKNGGPVSAGSMYRVGEGGMPEIYQASTGKQYMIPGDNGRVISNKDMQAGSGMNVVVNFNDYSSGSHSYDYQTTQDGNTLTVDAFIADMSNGGRMSQSISNYHNAPRRARGE